MKFEPAIPTKYSLMDTSRWSFEEGWAHGFEDARRQGQAMADELERLTNELSSRRIS